MTVPSSSLDLAEYNAPFRAGFASFTQRSFRTDPIRDEPAYRDHRREIGGAARRQDPVADHQPAAARRQGAADEVMAGHIRIQHREGVDMSAFRRDGGLRREGR